MQAFIDSIDKKTALAGGATVAATVAGVCAYRAAASGAAKSKVHAKADALDTSKLDAAVALIDSQKGNIAKHLSKAIQLRTISFEYPDGRTASVVGLDRDGSDGTSVREEGSGSAGGAGLKRSKGGCSCNCHGLRAALGVEDSFPSSTPSDAVSSPDPATLRVSRDALLAMHTHLEHAFPRMHAQGGPVTRHVINELSLVYIWRGARDCPPGTPGIGLAGHMDVVPVPDAAGWRHPPFAGAVAPDPVTGKECVWGRGAIDDKHSVIALCSAVESLLSVGYTPSVPYIVLMLGHDEELGGMEGARHAAQALPGLLQGVLGPQSGPLPSPPLSFLLDEGLFLLSDFVPAHAGPVAVVCIGEKGHLNVELSVEAPAGHSSVPGPTTTIGTLAGAITRLQSSPFPSHLHPASNLLTALLPGLPFTHRLVLANLWLTGPLVKMGMARSPQSAAMVRTTTAVTLVSGGLKSNVLPPRATAVVNHRIHPSDSVASVLARDAAVINDERVKIRPFEELEPAPVARSDDAAPGWAAVSTALHRVWSDSVTAAPGLMLGNTDTRHFWSIARDIYRHCPTELTMAGTAMFHGKDERITVDNLARIAAFYAGVVVEGCARVRAGAGGAA